MDFKDQIKQLSERIEKLKDSISTEEATKNAFVLPFIQSLGYDVFNPIEVIPEFTADIGTKKGEKVDYAIFKDNNPIILIECKHWRENLDIHNTQLLRYFNVTKAKFAILTNGISYRFYTDLDNLNIMDEKPFLDLNLTDLKEAQLEEVKKFHKSYFDIENIVNTASFLKYSNEVKNILNQELKQPSETFVKFFINKAYQGRATEKVLNQFTEIVKTSFQQFVSDIITERLKSVISQENETQKTELEKNINIQVKESTIETTQEELEAFYIIKSIVRKTIDSNRIFYRDFQKCFTILIDDSLRNPLCKLYLSQKVKQISFLDETKKEIKYDINTVDDLFNYSEQLVNAVKSFTSSQNINKEPIQ